MTTWVQPSSTNLAKRRCSSGVSGVVFFAGSSISAPANTPSVPISPTLQPVSSRIVLTMKAVVLFPFGAGDADDRQTVRGPVVKVCRQYGHRAVPVRHYNIVCAFHRMFRHNHGRAVLHRARDIVMAVCADPARGNVALPRPACASQTRYP